MKFLVTGSDGLIGSEVVEHFDRLWCEVLGTDNNMRAEFFGMGGRHEMESGSPGEELSAVSAP